MPSLVKKRRKKMRKKKHKKLLKKTRWQRRQQGALGERDRDGPDAGPSESGW